MVDDNWRPIRAGANVINNFLGELKMLLWNKAFWLDIEDHMMSYNQSEALFHVQ